MKRIQALVITLTILTAVGCKKSHDHTEGPVETRNQSPMAACPVCGQKMAEDTYCAGCNAVATTETDHVYCQTCDKNFKPGTYCAECNRFMLNATVRCENCRGQVVKGHYCPNEELFKGLPGIAYCQEHRRPYERDRTCPDCESGTES
jgi:hypothetical protein